MTPQELFYRFGVALFAGLLIGLQREYAHGKKELTAGARTFALVGLLGCSAAMSRDLLGSDYGFVAVFMVLGGLLIAGYVVQAIQHHAAGQTSEIAVVITFFCGALCYWDYLGLAVALAVATTLLLSMKQETQAFVKHLTREDIYAALKFAVVTAIVLPILPNQNFGPAPLNVFNPYQIWWMVVLVSGVSFLGFVMMQVRGSEQGITLAGLIGGMVSSTAVTVGLGQRSRNQPDLSLSFALAICVAWTMMFIRIGVIVGVLNLALLERLWMPLAGGALAGLIYSYYLYRAQKAEQRGQVALSNPFNLTPAIQFGLLYALMLVVTTLGQTFMGDAGVYFSSAVAGFVSVDAMVVSLSNLSAGGSLDLATAAYGVTLAAVANTVFKTGLLYSLASVYVRKMLLPVMALMLVCTLGLMLLSAGI